MKNIHILPKQEQTKCYCGHTSYCDCGPEEPKQEIKFEDVFNDEKKEGLKDLIDNHKQETLEEVAERYWAKQPYNEDAFIEGAKWQQERSYSEEEVKELLYKLMDYNSINKELDDLFEQFKKK